MSLSEVAILITALAAAGAAIYAIWRNGKRTSQDYGSLRQDVKGINDKLDNPDTGLSATNKGITDIKVRCAGVTGKFEQKIENLEAEVFDGKRQTR